MYTITCGPGSEILGNAYGQKNIRPPVGSRDSTIWMQTVKHFAKPKKLYIR